MVRDELRTAHTQLGAIADAVRQLSTADVNPDEPMTVEQVAESVKASATRTSRAHASSAVAMSRNAAIAGMVH